MSEELKVVGTVPDSIANSKRKGNGVDQDMESVDEPGVKPEQGGTLSGSGVPLPLEHGAKRRKLLLESKFKPPLMLFNELFPGNDLTVEVHSDGIRPIFKASVNVSNASYAEVGTSKQKAKTNVAMKVLKDLGVDTSATLSEAIAYPYASKYRRGNYEGPSAVEGQIGLGFGFENDDFHDAENLGMPRPQISTSLGVSAHPGRFEGMRPKMWGANTNREGNLDWTPSIKIDPDKAALHPTMVMLEIFPDVQLEWIVQDDSAQKFFVEARVKGQTFFGEARSKRLAKANLAKAILTTLCGVKNFVEEKKPIVKKAAKHPISQIKEKFPDASFVFDAPPGTDSAVVENAEIVAEADVEQIQNALNSTGNPSEKKQSFTATLTIRGESYIGIGSSKMHAKTNAAKKALSCLKSDPVPQGTITISDKIDVNKHPCLLFNELYVGNKFEALDNIEEDKDNMFGWQVSINGVIFSERSSSKKKAKAKLAMKVFKELHNIDPNSWSDFAPQDKETVSTSSTVAEPSTASLAGGSQGSPSMMSPTLGNKNPVSVLHELNPSLTCSFSEEPLTGKRVLYCATILISGKSFTGKGASKKLAKFNAAKLALSSLHGMDPNEEFFGSPVPEFDGRASIEDLPRDISDEVARLVLMKEADVLHTDDQCRVIAGFVLGFKNISGGYDNFEVVSLGTGTKCVSGDKLSSTGTVVNDCHAEIIACRAFRQYLYDQLEGIIQGKDSIMEKSWTGRRKLKNSIDLFLYISTAPCGDGRVFVVEGPALARATNKTAGLLRTKVENGQGTIPVKEDITQTTDGILAGDRLLTMSCSDKIMKWNVTGVQGALLSLFVDPVYITGLIIGHQYHHSHLNRALNERCKGVQDLPRPFRTQSLTFGRPTQTDRRDTSKTTSNSCNWYKGKATSEVLIATTGLTAVGSVSSLGKISFFKRFCELLKKSESNVMPQTYHSAKKMATSYQSSKTKLYAFLKERGFGHWVTKPIETDMFGF